MLKIQNGDLEAIKEIANERTLVYLYKLEERQRTKARKRKKKKFLKEKTKENILKVKSREFREDLIKKITPSEKTFKALLKYLKIPFEFQKIIYYEKSFYIADFYIPKLKSVIEIDGEYHNNQKEKDRTRTRILKGQGIKEVYRFTNKEIEDTKEVINRINRIMKQDI